MILFFKNRKLIARYYENDPVEGGVKVDQIRAVVLDDGHVRDDFVGDISFEKADGVVYSNLVMASEIVTLPSDVYSEDGQLIEAKDYNGFSFLLDNPNYTNVEGRLRFTISITKISDITHVEAMGISQLTVYEAVPTNPLATESPSVASQLNAEMASKLNKDAESYALAVISGILKLFAYNGTNPVHITLDNIRDYILTATEKADLVYKSIFATIDPAGGYVDKAKDSDKLGGQAPSHYDQNDHVTNQANPHNVTASQLSTATLAELATGGQVSIHWDNIVNKPIFADPSKKSAVATKGDLPLSGNAINDERKVINDGDGKSAWYYAKAESGATLEDVWVKFADVDYSADHGDLEGLAEDHHPQYLNNSRGDDRYYTKSELDLEFAKNTTILYSERFIIVAPDNADGTFTYKTLDNTEYIGNLVGGEYEFSLKDGQYMVANSRIEARVNDQEYWAIDDELIEVGNANDNSNLIKIKVALDFDDEITFKYHQGNDVVVASIGDGSISEIKIANNAVATAKIKDGAVTEAKLETNLATKVNSKTSSFVIYDQELLPANWSADPISGGTLDGYYQYDLDTSGNPVGKEVTDSDYATVGGSMLSSEDYDKAQFAKENNTATDQLTVYAKKKPTVSIYINYHIERGVA